MVDKAKVGQKIFALRKSKGITQDALAKLVSVTPQAISKWENGVALPDTGLLPVLARLFHIGMEELLCIHAPNPAVTENPENKRVMLPGIQYYPGTPSLVSCIKSSLNYIGIHVSPGWISAPYAFMLNINDRVSFMGPDFWNDNGCFDELIRNCGGIIENYSGVKDDADIRNKRMEAFEKIRGAIGKSLPCYAWEMDKPQYYMIAGYDETGYYYIDPDSKNISGPKPYDTLGESEWGILEIHIIRPGSISDTLKTLKDIFEFALSVGSPNTRRPSANPGYTMGIDAYRVWWEAAVNGNADPYGMAYNASFWAKCKSLAAAFLTEGKLRIGMLENLFDEAVMHYENAGSLLHQLSLAYPMSGSNIVTGAEQKESAARFLKAAQKAERKGLAAIENILNEIYKIW